MKKVILAFSLSMMILLTVLTVMTVDAKSIRQAEISGSLSEALETAVENAMSELYEDRAYATEDTQEFVSDFMEKLCIQIDSAEDLNVRILDIDEHGLLSVEVTAAFNNAGGRVSRVSCVKTAVFEKAQEDVQPGYAEVTYIVDGEAYKVYSIQKGSNVLLPKEPDTEKTFLYWIDENGNRIKPGDIVTENMTVTAYFS